MNHQNKLNEILQGLGVMALMGDFIWLLGSIFYQVQNPPYSAMVIVAGVAVIAMILGFVLPENLNWGRGQAQATERPTGGSVTEGSDAYAEMRKQRSVQLIADMSLFAQLVFWPWVTSVIALIVTFFGALTQGWGWMPVAYSVIGLGIFSLLDGYGILQRILGRLGLFWVIVPDMSVAFIERDGKLWRVYINCSEPRLRRHYLNYAAYVTKQGTGSKSLYTVEVLENSVVWIGLPWRNRLRPPWYEYSADGVNPPAQPFQFLPLKLRNIDYLPENKNGNPLRDVRGGVIPFVDSHDHSVQVSAAFTVDVLVSDPVKAMYAISFAFEGLLKEVKSAWADIAGKLSYLRRESDEEDKKHRLAVQFRAQIEMFEYFGLGQWSVDKEGGPTKFIRPVLVMKSEDNEYVYEYDPNFEEGTPARTCLDSFGLLIRAIRCTDVDPKDDEVRAAMTGVMEAEQAGKAADKRAEGEANATRKKGQADADARRAMGHAEADARRALGDADAQAARRLAEVAKSPGGRQAVDAWTSREVSQGVGDLNVTQISGSSGDVPRIGALFGTGTEAVKKPKSKRSSQEPPDPGSESAGSSEGS